MKTLINRFLTWFKKTLFYVYLSSFFKWIWLYLRPVLKWIKDKVTKFLKWTYAAQILVILWGLKELHSEHHILSLIILFAGVVCMINEIYERKSAKRDEV